MSRRLIPITLLCLATGGCATFSGPPPPPIRTPPENDVQLSEAARDPESYRGASVRWGGTILSTENRADYLQLEVLQRPLLADGKPAANIASDGRFIARVAPPPEKTVPYRRGRFITVAGVLREPLTLPLTENRQQTIPLVEATAYHAWRHRLRDYDERDDHYHYYPPRYYFGNPRYWPYYWPSPFHLHAPPQRGSREKKSEK